jgi:hypothetical protein
LADRKAHSHTTRFGREHRLKNPGDVGRLNARSGVFDRHMHFIGLAQFGFYAQHASLRRTHCLDGTHDQVQNHLL